MLSAIRAFAKSPIATVLLAVLIVAFGIWGVKDVFRGGGFTDQVVKAAGRPPVTKAQFKQAFDDARKSQAERGGEQMTPEDAVKNGVDRYVAEQLAATESLGALVSAEGINPSDQLIAGELRKITAFFNPVTGQFDKDVYERQLQARHLTEVQADAEFHDVVAQRHYISALSAGLKAPRIYGLVQAALIKQGADFQWFLIAPDKVEPPAKPTDAQLNALLKDAQAKPEQRQLTLVNISSAKLAQTIDAPEAEVQKRFDFEKDTLSVPEKRTVVQIAVKDAAAGAKAAEQLKAGANPMTVAKALGAQATTYPNVAKSEIVDPKVADAAFSMKAGEVSAPIQGTLGLAVIKVVDVTPAKPATLADSRAKIEAEVKQQRAKQKIYDQVQKYEDSHSGGSPMADAAKAAGVQAVTLPSPIMASGGTLDGRRANMPPKVLQQAFSLPQGGESDVIETSPGEYWVVHVDKVIPSAPFGLDDPWPGGGKVRDIATRQFMLDELTKRLTAKADGLVAEIAKGKSLDAAAAEVGAKTAQASDVTRAAARATAPNQPPEYSPEFIGKLFAARAGDVVVGPAPRGGMIVARLGKFDEASPEVLAALGEQARDGVSRALFNDMLEATALAARSRTKTVIDMTQARQALGVDTDSGKSK